MTPKIPVSVHQGRAIVFEYLKVRQAAPLSDLVDRLESLGNMSRESAGALLAAMQMAGQLDSVDHVYDQDLDDRLMISDDAWGDDWEV